MSPSSWKIDINLLLNDPVGFFQTLFSSAPNKTMLLAYGILGFLILMGILLAQKYLTVRNAPRSFDPLREAEQAAKSRDPYRAGQLFEQAGEHDQAIRSYKEAKAYQQVARIYEMKKQWEEAAQFYKLAGDPEKSAMMYQKGGQYVRAAESYLVCKKNVLAAEMYEKGKRPRDAALQYERFGNLLKAAALYEQAGDLKKGADLHERHFLSQKIESGQGASPERIKQANQTAYQAGQLNLKIKNFQKAMELFSSGGFLSQAAEAALAAGETEKAAQFYLSAKAFEKASDLYQRLGDSRQGHLAIAKKYQEEGAFPSAGEAFEKGESWIEAGEMYERAGGKIKAGEMYRTGGDYHRAGELFLEAGEEASAADCLEKGGRFKEAAELYMKLNLYDKAAKMQEAGGNYFGAALLFKQEDKIDQSIAYLQKVDSRSGDYYQASLLLGQILIERGMIDAARERYQKIISQEPIALHNIEFYYQLALICEKRKEFEEAQSLYEKILAEDYNYKDVKGRGDLLKKALAEVKKTLESTRMEKQAEPSPLPPESEAARYKILKKIGQGGMGVVYQAEDMVLKRIVAYKILPPSIKENEAVLQNFLQEARIAAALNHPNIVTLYDTGKNDDEIFITMEFIDGMTLKDYLEKGSPSLAQLVEIMKEICQGVGYAHSKNVIHRDLKPANVMLTQDHKVKIMDFGLAKVVSDSITDKTTVKGTPLYMAPEQILGEKVDHQSDIYSLGCAFYRMVAGRPPFTQGDVYYHHLHTPPAPPRTLNAKLSPELEKIIMKCIEKGKADRYKKVAEITYALERLP